MALIDSSTTLTQDEDNCLQCAIGMLFGIGDLSDVPHFIKEGEDWWIHFAMWLEENFGLEPFYIENDIGDGDYWHPAGKHITVGLSPRELHHACVYEGDELWYDPHPSQAGLRYERGVYLMHKVIR